MKDKARGMLVGLAVGDALGANFEFASSESIVMFKEDVYDMKDTENYPKGVWTDDTSMALCLADSLLECGGYDSFDVMEKNIKWRNDGYRSYFPMGYGIGIQTDHALSVFENRNQVIKKNEKRELNAGNGAIMRLAPVILASIFPRVIDEEKCWWKINPYDNEVHNPNMCDEVGENIVINGKLTCEFLRSIDDEFLETIKLAQISARETHYSIEAESATKLFAVMLYLAMHDASKETITTNIRRNFFFDDDTKKLLDDHPEIIERMPDKSGEKLKDLGGYILDAISIAGWGLLNFDTFEEGMVEVICLGGDTDTNAAIYGQLAGAYYGYKSIPKRWIKDLYLHEEIVEIADKLLAMKKCPIVKTRFEEDKD